MNDAIVEMLKRYECTTADSYRNALKEIIQELALFGLWRSKFFEHAAFYGGTALRILHGLNRFSEDLDFSLLSTSPSFSLKTYEDGIRKELESLGLTLDVEVKDKNQQTAVQSAFLKGNTVKHLLHIGMPEKHAKFFHKEELVKVKFEIDTDPPPRFNTEAVFIFHPSPFSIVSYSLPDIFAGKISALLFREWKSRVKGRDWYDFLWLVGKNIPVNLDHLQARLEQIGKWPIGEPLKQSDLAALIHQKIEKLEIQHAKEDLFPFLRDSQLLDSWSKPLFHAAVDQLKSQ